MKAYKNMSIYHIADEMDRLFPDQVDKSISGNGQQEAGHRGHDTTSEHPEHARIGWYCEGGNCGNPVMAIRDEHIDLAYSVLRGCEPAEFGSIDDLCERLRAAGVDCEALA